MEREALEMKIRLAMEEEGFGDGKRPCRNPKCNNIIPPTARVNQEFCSRSCRLSYDKDQAKTHYNVSTVSKTAKCPGCGRIHSVICGKNERFDMKVPRVFCFWCNLKLEDIDGGYDGNEYSLSLTTGGRY